MPSVTFPSTNSRRAWRVCCHRRAQWRSRRRAVPRGGYLRHGHRDVRWRHPRRCVQAPGAHHAQPPGTLWHLRVDWCIGLPRCLSCWLARGGEHSHWDGRSVCSASRSDTDGLAPSHDARDEIGDSVNRYAPIATREGGCPAGHAPRRRLPPRHARRSMHPMRAARRMSRRRRVVPMAAPCHSTTTRRQRCAPSQRRPGWWTNHQTCAPTSLLLRLMTTPLRQARAWAVAPSSSNQVRGSTRSQALRS